MATKRLFIKSLIGGVILGSLLNIAIYSVVLFAPPVFAKTGQAFMAALEPLSGTVPEETSLNISKPVFQAVHVNLKNDDRALMLEAVINQHQKTILILDTGATYTAISQELAQQLGYDLDHAEKISITTANGQVSLPKVTLKSLTLNGFTANNVEATVMAMPKSVPFSGLLGLNFVKNHRITIDAASEQLVIEPKS